MEYTTEWIWPWLNVSGIGIVMISMAAMEMIVMGFPAADKIGPSYLVWLTPGRAANGKGAKRQQQDVAHTRPALAQALRPEAGRLAKVHRVAASPSARRSGWDRDYKILYETTQSFVAFGQMPQACAGSYEYQDSQSSG